FELTRTDHWSPVLREITRAIAFTRTLCMVQLSTGNEVTCVWKSRHCVAARIQARVATGVIEMQMRVDDDRDVVRLNTGAHLQRFAQRTHAIDAVHRLLFWRPLVANSGFDQDLFRAGVDEHTIHVHSNSVV